MDSNTENDNNELLKILSSLKVGRRGESEAASHKSLCKGKHPLLISALNNQLVGCLQQTTYTRQPSSPRTEWKSSLPPPIHANSTGDADVTKVAWEVHITQISEAEEGVRFPTLLLMSCVWWGQRG